MRVVVLALTLALVAGQPYCPPTFKTGLTYVYNYETLLTSGLPEENLAKTGFKINSKVLISAESEHNHLLKFTDTNIFELNGIWSTNQSTPSSKLTSALVQHLVHPIRFEYNRGVIRKIMAPANVSTLVLNILKGALNSLALTMKQSNTYDVWEDGTQGICKTTYMVNEEDKEGHSYVCKTRNLNICKESVIKNMGLAYTHRCAKCQEDAKSLEGETTYEYILKSHADHVQILNVTVKELIKFSPLGPANGAVEMSATQNLSFIKFLETPIPPSRVEYVNRGSLRHKFEDKLSQMPLKLIKTKILRDQIVETLDWLINPTVERPREDAPEHFFRMIQLLRSASREDLAFLWSQIKTRPASRQWILDFLAAIGTPDALRLIKEKFCTGDVTNAEMAQAMITSVHMVTATSETFEIFKEMANNDKIRESRVLYKIILLGYGTMVAKHCSDQAACPKEHIKFIHDRLSQAKDIEEIILLLKVMGNAGHADSLKPIMKILPISHRSTSVLPIRVMAAAIMALRSIAKKEPKKVQEVASKLYMDRHLDVELRMLACIILFESNPSSGLVTTLANFLKAENNLQLASFTYSHMKVLSRSTPGIHRSVAAACNNAMRILGPKLNRQSLQFSKVIQLETYNKTLMLGAAATAFYIKDYASFFPKTVMAKTSWYLMGATADLVEFGIRTDGLQEVLLKNPILLNNSDRLTKMKKAIKALSQWKSWCNANPLLSLNLRVMGQEVAFVDIDQSMVEEILQIKDQTKWWENIKRSMVSGVSKTISKSLLVSEVRRIMPTVAGLPLQLSLFTAAVTAADVTVKPKITPELPEVFRLSELLERDIQLNVDVKPSIALRTFASIGINTEMFQSEIVSRIKFSAVAPINISAELNIANGKFKIEALPVTLPKTVTAVHIDTLAVTRNIEDLSAERVTSLIPDQVQNPVSIDSPTSQMEESVSHSTEAHFYKPAQPRGKSRDDLVEKKYIYKVLGLRGEVIMSSENASFIRDTPLYRVAGKHYADVSITPVSEEVYEKLELVVEVGSKAAQNLVKQIDLDEEEIIEGKPVLMKLRQLLSPAYKTVNSTSSSSRSSQSSSSSDSSKISSTSSSSKSSSSSSKSSSSSSKSSKSSSSSSSKSSSSSSSSSKLRSKSSRSSSSSSSASNLASLFSASSSASHQSGRVTKQITETLKFTKNFKKQNSKAASSSRSSGGNFEAIYGQPEFLVNKEVSTVVVTARAVRDRKEAGYKLSVNVAKNRGRIWLNLADLAPQNKYKICVNGVLQSHKATVKISDGVECRESRTNITAETGLVGLSPAARLRMTWNKIPDSLKHTWKWTMKNIPLSIVPSFELQKNKSDERQASLTIVAHAEKAVDIILKTPKFTIVMLVVRLPMAIPREGMDDLIPFDDIMDKIHFVVTQATAAKCSYTQDKLTTFNMRTYNPQMPLSCYQVLAQDCTDELKFIVLLKSDNSNQNHINVKISDIDIDLYPKGISTGVKVNGREIQVENLPYQHPLAKIQIRPKGEGVSVYAPSLGLHEVYYNKSTWMVQVVDWMKGQTCGLCGKADGEIEQEFRTPSGFVSKNPVASAHSWILPAASCKSTSECRIRLESIELEKKAVIYGQESRCFSVQPVLRCLPGCYPVKTAPITVDFHCVAAQSNVNKSEVLRGIHEKSIDLRERAEAHLACSCTPQCV